MRGPRLSQDLSAKLRAVFIFQRLGIAAHQRLVAYGLGGGGLDRMAEEGGEFGEMAGGVGQKQVEVHPADAVSGELRCIEFEGSHLAGPTQRRLAGFGHGSEVQFKTRASALESLEARRAHDL